MSKQKAYLYILASFAWLIVGGTLFSLVDPSSTSAVSHIVAGGLLLGFAAIFLVGTAIWAGAKGYHPILGVLLGWIGPLGLLILVFLPDRAA